MRSCGWLILKFSRERSVWAPQYLSAGTWISPKASLSVLVLAMVAEALNSRVWGKLWVFNGVYLGDWRMVVESGRRLRAHMAGLAFACASASDLRGPASAGRSLEQAVRNMAAEWEAAGQATLARDGEGRTGSLERAMDAGHEREEFGAQTCEASEICW